MKAMIKDLVHRVMAVGNSKGEFQHYLIIWEANVVIKREGIFYEVPLKLKYDTEDDDNTLLDLMSTAYEGFVDHCDKISANWKLVDEELEGTHGKVIGQRKIEL